MRVPSDLASAFGAPFEELISRFATEQKLMPEPDAIRSPRFLARSVVPHIQKLSSLFNRDEVDQGSGLEPYWKESSNPANLRLAYFLYFMPSNLFRVAAIWAELARLGFRWNAGGSFKGIEFGAGPATGACGIAAGEHFAPVGLPREGNWALIEQDKAMLELGTKWAETYFAAQELGAWGTRPFHRKIEWDRGLLPKSAPQFNLWVMSYFLNEATKSPRELARIYFDSWDRHLEDEGLVIFSEPALKLQSRKLLELRKALIELQEEAGRSDYQVLLPCMGHQACGALAAPEDWCHEEVMWWRPPYFRTLDQMAGLDRKSLPFSYLVIIKSKRPREEILPELRGSDPSRRFRLVSPSHAEGKELEFFVCGKEGKRRARYRPKGAEDPGKDLGRGSLMLGAELRGDVHASRVEKIDKVR